MEIIERERRSEIQTKLRERERLESERMRKNPRERDRAFSELHI